MVTLSIRGLPASTTEESLTQLFSQYGVLHSVALVRDMFTGKCKGFATIKMEGHEAKVAVANVHNREVDGSVIRVEVGGRKGRSTKRRR